MASPPHNITQKQKKVTAGEVKFSWLCAYTDRKVHLKRLFKEATGAGDTDFHLQFFVTLLGAITKV